MIMAVASQLPAASRKNTIASLLDASPMDEDQPLMETRVPQFKIESISILSSTDAKAPPKATSSSSSPAKPTANSSKSSTSKKPSKPNAGKRCYIDGCNCCVQRYGLCWKHGGYNMCSVEGCKKRAKTNGTCARHGGGSRCLVENCNSVSISNGFCWSHGGGRRCVMPGCRRLAYKNRQNHCMHHYKLMQEAKAQEGEEEASPSTPPPGSMSLQSLLS